MINTRQLESNVSAIASCATVIAVRVNGAIVWHHVIDNPKDPIGHGRSRLRFPIYSITKTLSALCVLRLQKAGLLHVEDPVRRWLPDLAVTESITLSHLLRHRSGLRDYGAMPSYHEAVRNTPSSPWTAAQFIELARQELLFEPGMGWAYSNVGYMFLRLVIESASAQTFRNALTEHVIIPLGLEDTFVADDICDWSTCVPGYGHEVDIDGNVVGHP